MAAVFQRLLALVFLIAWISLGWQIRALVGERGLVPLWAFLDETTRAGLPLFAYPSLFRWQWLARDGVLVGGTIVGALLAVVAIIGLRPRLCFALSTGLYLSYVVACRSFLAFQWDNLLLECGFLATFLRADRPASVVHMLFRLLAFKLYFESGIAKWQSAIKDWHDGSAMTFYYETAPLPTFIAWYFHNLPAWWHHFESRAALVLELVVPFAMFGPRRARLAAAASLTGFQVLNVATANYGFFCYLALTLHVFLLDDGDIPRRLSRLTKPRGSEAPRGSRVLAFRSHPARFLSAVGLSTYVLLSLISAGVRFTDGGAWMAWVDPVRRVFEPLRIVNTYHLFASITRDRIEPEFQVKEDNGAWVPLALWHKPGDPVRRPNFVAPHQPRVDFLLWFYGLGYRSRQPLYVMAMLERLCREREAVRGFFRTPLPRDPAAARMVYWRYNFTTWQERRETGAWWKRTLADEGPPASCRE